MTSALQVFSYQDTQIRTYTDENGDVWFVAKDVCEILGIQNHKDAITGLDDDEKSGVAITDPHGREQVTNVINEPGLYKLTFKSRKPEAKKFTHWVTHEVLPQIRKTGSYTIPQAEQAEHELNPVNIRAAEVLQKLANMLPAKTEQRKVILEAIKLVTGLEIVKPKSEQPKHTPRHWTAQQVGATLKWPADAVMHRAENLGLTKKPVNGYWDGETWYFSKEGRQKFLDLVRAKIVKIEDGYEYYENGYKRIHWSFDPDEARL